LSGGRRGSHTCGPLHSISSLPTATCVQVREGYNLQGDHTLTQQKKAPPQQSPRQRTTGNSSLTILNSLSCRQWGPSTTGVPKTAFSGWFVSIRSPSHARPKSARSPLSAGCLRQMFTQGINMQFEVGSPNPSIPTTLVRLLGVQTSQFS
jgi:hypothetical protein